MEFEPRDMTSLLQANVGNDEKCSLHLIFIFYLNRDTSVIEFSLSLYFDKKRTILHEIRVDPINYKQSRL